MKTYDPQKTSSEVRQGNSRKMNLRVLVTSTVGLIILLAVLYGIYAWMQPPA